MNRKRSAAAAPAQLIRFEIRDQRGLSYRNAVDEESAAQQLFTVRACNAPAPARDPAVRR